MLIFIFLILSFCNIYAQIEEDSTYFETDETILDLLQEPSEESDNSDLYNLIEELIENPLNINEANQDELQRIPYIDFQTANLIVNYRKKYGHFFSINELNSVKGISVETVRKISSFLTTGKNISNEKNLQSSFSDNSSFNLRCKFQEDIQDRKGFIENKFKGSKYKIYNRIIAGYKNFEIGFLTDKDPGENSLTDFSSYFFSIKKVGLVKNLILGDYLVNWGQGLVLWSPYGFSKGADAVYSAQKKSQVIKKYTSSAENNFMRGIAANLEFDNFSITAFYSKNNLDANIDSISNGILSTPIDGLHRTENEINKRETTAETVYGTALDFTNDFVHTGILYYQSVFNNPFIAKSVLGVSGNAFRYTSIFYNLYFTKLNFFGETAYDGKSLSTINGIELPINKDFTFVTSIRSYPKNFNSIHGFSFGEAGKNEFGIYNGLKWISPAGTVNLYYDQFKFPYSSSDISLPRTGSEFLIDYKNKPVKNLETNLRFKYENKEVPFSENNVSQIVNKIRNISRIEIIYRVTHQLKLKGRFEYNYININDNIFENGFLTFQDLQYHLFPGADFYSRIIFFSTVSFNSAFYEYENDIAGTFLSHILFGQGVRWYIMLKLRLFENFIISGKYSETFKPKEKSIGSGLSEISGNLDNRFSLQLDINY